MPPIVEALISAEEFIHAELESEEGRHEFIDGLVVPLAATSRRHNKIVFNVQRLLRDHLEGCPCFAYAETIMVNIEEANCFYCPDVMVTCDQEGDDSIFARQPVLVVEVLSRSTAARDRLEKRRNYMRLESLREYLLIRQKRQLVELYRKEPDGNWSLSILGGDEMLLLESMPKGTLRVAVSEFYRDTDAQRISVVKEDHQFYMVSEEEDY